VLDASVAIDLFAGRDRAKGRDRQENIHMLKGKEKPSKGFASRLFLAEVPGFLAGSSGHSR